jgi:hypothetical protein
MLLFCWLTLIKFYSSSPIFVVSNVLLISSPPALTLAQVCRRFLCLARILIPLCVLDHPSRLWRFVRAAHQSYGLLVVLHHHTAIDDHIRRCWSTSFQIMRHDSRLKYTCCLLPHFDLHVLKLSPDPLIPIMLRFLVVVFIPNPVDASASEYWI